MCFQDWKLVNAWSIIVVSETCLCPKSYLCGSRVWCGQICQHMWQVGGNGAGDLAGEPFIDGPRRVSPDAGTEDGGTGVVARVRHLQ